DVAFVAFPGAVPEIAVDPSDAGDDAVGLDGAEDRSRLGIDLVDLAAPMLANPERAFVPGEPGVAAVARRRDGREHAAALRIDLLDAVLGDLKEVPAVEGGSRVRGDLDRAQHLSARRIESVQLVAGGKPDVLAVERQSVHALDAGERSVLAEDF